jgi:hypothetical protein
MGIIIWWAEGTKSRRDKRWVNARSYPIEVTNTNPAIIKIFLDFLINDMNINASRISVQLQIHLGDDQKGLEQYWESVTGISRNKFNKTIVRPVGNKIGKSKGTCKVRFADKNTYVELEKRLLQVLSDTYLHPNKILKHIPDYEFKV